MPVIGVILIGFSAGLAAMIVINLYKSMLKLTRR